MATTALERNQAGKVPAANGAVYELKTRRELRFGGLTLRAAEVIGTVRIADGIGALQLDKMLAGGNLMVERAAPRTPAGA